MTALDERYSDIISESSDLEVRRVVAGLDALGREVATRSLSTERDHVMRDALMAHASECRLPNAVVRPAWTAGWTSYRIRLISLASAAVIVLAGVLGYGRLQAPASVSAAQILQRAARAMGRPAAGDVVREVVTYAAFDAAGAPLTQVTTTQWARFTADGSIDRFNLTLVANGQVEEHDVLNAQGYWFYSPAQNSVTQDPPSLIRLEDGPGGVVWPKSIIMEPQNLAALRRLLLTAASGKETQLLPPQTVDGHRVDVVQMVHREPDSVNGSPVSLPPTAPKTETFTLSIDASTYVLQRLDEHDRNRQGATTGTSTLRVVGYQVMPEAQAPADVFAYSPPPGAQVQRCNGATPPVCSVVHPSPKK
jgi:hypothetical protein